MNDDIVVLPNSRWAHSIRTELGDSLVAVMASPNLGQDDLLRRLSQGRISATVAPSNAVSAAQAEYKDLHVEATLNGPMDLCWMVRSNATELLTALNRHLSRNLGASREGLRRSRVFGVIHDRYVDDPSQVRYYREAAARPDRTGRICVWDTLIQEVADKHGLDWLLVASLIFEESRFNPSLVSSAGAVGLMQIMPRYADKDSTQLHDPRINIEFGVKYLTEILSWYDFLEEEDRWLFSVATYHAGTGHMNDARRIVMDAGLDPNRWKGNVEIGLRRLREDRHSRRSRHGFYRGDRSVRYAEAILRRVEVYRVMLERAETVPD